jgi:tetratricopeptide (TPR) repeat protein
VVAYLVKTGGWKMVFALCNELQHNPDYRSAIKKATGKPFERFWADWVDYARGLGYKEIKGMEITVLEIKKGQESGDDDDEQVDESDLAQGDEWKYARLGDLLRDRGHYREASVEYGRALSIAPYSLRILNKAGLCYYLDKDYGQSLAPLREAVQLYPGYSTTYINLGRTLFEMGRKEEARQALEQALDINPFNPIPYRYLEKIYGEKNDQDRVNQLKENYDIITG